MADHRDNPYLGFMILGSQVWLITVIGPGKPALLNCTNSCHSSRVRPMQTSGALIWLASGERSQPLDGRRVLGLVEGLDVMDRERRRWSEGTGLRRPSLRQEAGSCGWQEKEQAPDRQSNACCFADPAGPHFMALILRPLR